MAPNPDAMYLLQPWPVQSALVHTLMYGVRICSFYEASGEGVDINGRMWRWDFSKEFGPLWIDHRGNPLKVQPAEKSPAWPVFNRWLAERNKS